jgi:hypothetical protein
MHLSRTPHSEKHFVQSYQEPCGQEPKEGRNQFQFSQVYYVKSYSQEPLVGQN